MSTLTLVVGAAVFALFVVLQFRSRAKIAKSGLEPEPMSLTWIKIVVAAPRYWFRNLLALPLW